MAIDRTETAYHEAGHTVIAYRLGLNIGSTSILPDEATFGRAVGEEVWVNGTRDVDYIVALYAGLAAQRRFNPDADARRARGDYERAAEPLRFVSEGQAALEKRAAELVKQYWPEIEALAAALLIHDTLDGEEADFIIDVAAEGWPWENGLATFRERRRLSVAAQPN